MERWRKCRTYKIGVYNCINKKNEEGELKIKGNERRRKIGKLLRKGNIISVVLCVCNNGNCIHNLQIHTHTPKHMMTLFQSAAHIQKGWTSSDVMCTYFVFITCTRHNFKQQRDRVHRSFSENYNLL